MSRAVRVTRRSAAVDQAAVLLGVYFLAPMIALLTFLLYVDRMVRP